MTSGRTCFGPAGQGWTRISRRLEPSARKDLGGTRGAPAANPLCASWRLFPGLPREGARRAKVEREQEQTEATEKGLADLNPKARAAAFLNRVIGDMSGQEHAPLGRAFGRRAGGMVRGGRPRLHQT